MASAMRGNDDGADANVKKATTKPAVTNPAVVRQITVACVAFSVVLIFMFASAAYAEFSVDGPLWKAFARSAGLAALFLIPVCLVPRLRAELISMSAEQPSDDGTGSDLSAILLGHEIV